MQKLESICCYFDKNSKILYPISDCKNNSNCFAVTDPIIEFSDIFNCLSKDDRKIILESLNEDETSKFINMEKEKMSI